MPCSNTFRVQQLTHRLVALDAHKSALHGHCTAPYQAYHCSKGRSCSRFLTCTPKKPGCCVEHTGCSASSTMSRNKNLPLEAAAPVVGTPAVLTAPAGQQSTFKDIRCPTRVEPCTPGVRDACIFTTPDAGSARLLGALSSQHMERKGSQRKGMKESPNTWRSASGQWLRQAGLMQAQQAGKHRSCHVRVIPAGSMCTPSIHTRHACQMLSIAVGGAQQTSGAPLFSRMQPPDWIIIRLLLCCGRMRPLLGSPSLMRKGGGVLSGAVALKARRMAHARQEPALCGLALVPLQERRHLSTCKPHQLCNSVPLMERRGDMLTQTPCQPGSATSP